MFWKKKKSKPELPVNKDGDSNSYFLKIALLGDGAVGKTSIRRNFMGMGFVSDHMMTIGADFAAHDMPLKFDDRDFSVTYQIWDLAGQDTFSDVRSMYYKGCFGCLLVFDRTRPTSFENLPGWIDELTKHSGRGIVPVIVLGNKYDLIESSEFIVDDESINKYMEELNEKYKEEEVEFHYFDTSAKSGLNVSDAFQKLGTDILTWLKA